MVSCDQRPELALVFCFGEKMSQPTTQWIRDSGRVVEQSTAVLVDELGNFFVDELGNNLLDSVSTDGEVLAQAWSAISETTTTWADSYEARISTATRTTVQGDTRTTVQGDTRIALTSDPNIQNTTSWTEDEY